MRAQAWIGGRLLAVAGAVLALAVGTAGPAAAHAGDPTLVTRLHSVTPALPAEVAVQVRSTISDELAVTNPTTTPLAVLDPDGAEFLRIAADGVQGNTSSPYFQLTSSPPNVRAAVPASARAGAAPVWVPLSAEPSWRWFDPRLTPAFLQVPVGGRQEVADVKDVATWTVPLRYGAEPATIEGALVRRPVTGQFETTLDPAPAGMSAVIGQSYVPTLSAQAVTGHEVTVLGRDGQPYLRFTPTGAQVNRDSPTYRDDVLGRSRPVPATDTGWAPLPGTSTTWLDTRLRFPAEDPPAELADATAPVEAARWEIPVIVDGTPQVLSGSIRWLPLPRATGSPWTTIGIIGGVVLLLVGGGLLLLRNRRLAAAAGSAVVVLSLAACGGQATLTPAVTPDGVQHVELHRGHTARYAVPVGSTVEVLVASDVADEVHLHGYDRHSFVTAGATTTLRFVADVPGIFEVELEGSGEQLGQLAVS